MSKKIDYKKLEALLPANQRKQLKDLNVHGISQIISALECTQKSCVGSFENGYTILVTGHQMHSIRLAIRKMKELE